MHTEQVSDRVVYFDQAKAYLIILVMIGHILIVLNPGYEKLYLSAVQSFICTFVIRWEKILWEVYFLFRVIGIGQK